MIARAAAPGLLISVRDAEEARAALAGGATLIDVKDPDRGALGAASLSTIAEILNAVQGRVPVSAALGELEDERWLVPPAVALVKWGLANQRQKDWPATFERLAERARTLAVTVAYADWECALAPSLDDVVRFACARPGGVLLIDTCCKDANLRGRRPTLLDWVSLEQLQAVREATQQAQVRLALAGSLGFEEILSLLPLAPDWIAVRGVACVAGDRGARVDQGRVRTLASLVLGESI